MQKAIITVDIVLHKSSGIVARFINLLFPNVVSSIMVSSHPREKNCPLVYRSLFSGSVIYISDTKA